MSSLLPQVMHGSPFEHAIVPFLMPMDVTRMVSTSKNNQSVTHTKGKPHRRLCVSCMTFHPTAEIGFQCSRCSDVTLHCPVCRGPFAVQVEAYKSRIRCPSCCLGPLRVPVLFPKKGDNTVPLQKRSSTQLSPSPIVLFPHGAVVHQVGVVSALLRSAKLC